MCRSKKGFTLAEVLITLVVIGVIAALTIPALLQNIQDAQNRAAWRKSFSDISQASRKLATANGGSLNSLFLNDNDTRDKLSDYLSYAQKCDDNTALGPNGCWNSQIYNLSGKTFDFWDITEFSRMVLNNGMLLAFYRVSQDCTYDRAAKDNGCAQVGIDVNGFKGPNTVGKDIYWGYITEDGSFESFGKSGDWWSTGYPCCSTCVGFSCSTQYLQQ